MVHTSDTECGTPKVRFLDEVQGRIQMVIDRLQNTDKELANSLSAILGDTLDGECPCNTSECYSDPSAHCGGTYTSSTTSSVKAPAVCRILHAIELLEVVTTQLEKNVRRANQI